MGRDRVALLRPGRHGRVCRVDAFQCLAVTARGAETRDALVSLLDGDAAATATRFAADCLLPPEVASARPDDPQPKQLVPVIVGRLRSGHPVRVLEIGAGRGRLINAIAEMLRADPSLRPEQLTYIAYQDLRRTLTTGADGTRGLANAQRSDEGRWSMRVRVIIRRARMWVGMSDRSTSTRA